MPDKITEAYSAIKSSNLFVDENDFREQLQKSPKDVFNVVGSTGLFVDYDDFENSLGLKKKEVSQPSAQISGQPSSVPSPSQSQLLSRLTFNDIEGYIERAKKAEDNYNNLKNSSNASAGVGAPGLVVPKAKLDQAKIAVSTAMAEKDRVLQEYSKDIDRVAGSIIERGETDKFFEGDIFNPKVGREYVERFTEKYGGGKYLQEQMLSVLKTRLQEQKDKPLMEEFLKQEFSARGINQTKYGQDLFNKLTQPQVRTIDDAVKESKDKANKVLDTAKSQAEGLTQQFSQFVEGLNTQIETGQITADQAKEIYGQRLEEYNKSIKDINDSYVRTVRDINVNLRNRYNRIQGEVKKVQQSITPEMIDASIPAADKKKIQEAYTAATNKLFQYKNEKRKVSDQIGGPGVPGGVYTSVFSRGLTSGFSRALASFGDYMLKEGVSNDFSKWLSSFSKEAEQFQTGEYDWKSPLLKFSQITGQTIGGSLPAMAPALALSIIPGMQPEAAALAIGTTSALTESTQEAGGQFRSDLDKGMDVVTASTRADKVFDENMKNLPLYMIGGLGDFLLVSKSGLLNKAGGLVLENVGEIPLSVRQEYEKAKLDGYNKPVTTFIKENPDILVDTFVGTLGMGGAMAGFGKAYSSITSKSPAPTTQSLQDIIQKSGVDVAKTVVQKYYENGVIDQKELNKQLADIDRIAQTTNKMAEFGVTGDKAKLLTALSDQEKDLKVKVQAEQDPALKNILQGQLTDVQNDIKGVTDGSSPYITFTLPGGNGMTRVMTERQFNALDQEAKDDVIKSADKIAVTGNEELQKNLDDQKTALGNAPLPDGAYINSVQTQQPAQKQPTLADELKKDLGIDEEVKTSVQESLKSLPVNVVVRPDAEVTDMAKRLGGDGTERAFFNDETGQIVLREGAGDIDIIHEGAHPALNILFNTNRKQYDQVVAGLKATAQKNEGVAAAVRFGQQYEGQAVQDNEALTESIAMIGTGQIDLNTIDPGFKQTLIDFINKIAKVLGFEPVLGDTDTAAFKKLAGDIANALKSGTDITKVVGEGSVENSISRANLAPRLSNIEIDRGKIESNVQAATNDIKSAPIESETGVTFNLDGTTFTGQGLIVPAASMNTTQEELSPKMVADFIESNKGKLSDGEMFKVGYYKFPNSNQVSIDLNIVVDPKNREAAVEFGKQAGQESLFDLGTFENVKTGADGSNPIQFTDEEFAQIAVDLKEGRVPSFDSELVEDIPDVIASGQMRIQPRKTDGPAVNVYEQKGVDQLPVRSISDIYSQFGGRAVVINSDPTRVGELTLPSGKKIFTYGGPGYLSISDNVSGNVGFATTQISKVNSWNKYVKDLFGNEKGVTLVSTQTPISMLGNSYALRYVMDAISQLPKSVLRSSDFKSEFFGKDLGMLKEAFGEKGYNEFIKKYKGADLSNPEVIDGMISEMAYKIGDDNRPASFKARGAFVSNLLGGIVEKSKRKGMEGQAGYISKDPNKFIAKELMKRFGLNQEKLFYELGEKSIVDLFMNEGKWGMAVAGFETDPNISIESVQGNGVKHPLFNAKFPGSNPFILDGAYELNELFTPIEMTGPSGAPYTKTAAMMTAGSMYVKGTPQQTETSFEFRESDAAGDRIQFRKGDQDFKLAEFVIRQRANGKTDADIRTAIKEVLPSISNARLDELFADPEAYANRPKPKNQTGLKKAIKEATDKRSKDVVVMPEIVALKKQMKDFERGLRVGMQEGFDTAKSEQSRVEKMREYLRDRVSNILNKAMDAGAFTGEVRGRVLAAAIKRLNSAKSPVAMMRFTEYLSKLMADVEYDAKLQQGKSIRASLKSALKKKGKNASTKAVLAEFARIDPALVDNIEVYNDIAQQVLNVAKGVRVTGGNTITVNNVQFDIDNQTIEEYIDAYNEFRESEAKQNIIDTYSDLIDQGIIDPATMSLEDMQFIIDSIYSDVNDLDGVDNKQKKLEALREVVNTHRNVLGMLENIDPDLFADLTKEEKRILDNIKEIDINTLDIKQLAKLNDIINEILVNRSFTGAGEIALINEANKAIDQAKKIDNGTLGSVTNTFIKGFASFQLMNEFIFKSSKIAAEMQRVLGVVDLFSGYARAKKLQENAIKEYLKLKKGMKDVDSAYNRYVRGVVADVMNNFGGTDEDINTEFDRRKNWIKTTYERLLASDVEREQQEGRIIEQVYNTILADSETIDEVLSKVDDNNKKLVQFWRDKFAERMDALAENAALYNNQLFEAVDNYTSTSVKGYNNRMGVKEMGDAFDSVFMSNKISYKEAGTKKKKTRAPEPPKDSVLDLDFDNVQSKRYYQSNFDIETSKAVIKIKQVMSNPEFAKIFGGTANAKIVSDSIISSYKMQKGTTPPVEEWERSLTKGANILQAKGVRIALGGVSQFLKQYPSVAFSALVNLGADMDLFVRALGVSNKIKLFDNYLVGLRGDTKAGFSKEVDYGEIDRAVVGGNYEMISSSLENVGKQLSDLALAALTKSDVSVARTSWLAYYMQDLRRQGIDISNIDWENEHSNPNEEAAAYAEQMVSRSQNANDASTLGNMFKKQSGFGGFVKNVFLPFSSFSVNQRVRMTNDMQKLLYGENKAEAARSLVATAAEVTLFNAVKVYIIGMLTTLGAETLAKFIGLMGEDDDELAKKLAKQDKERKGNYSKVEVAGVKLTDKQKKVAAQALSDYFFSGMGSAPQEWLQQGANYLYNKNVKETLKDGTVNENARLYFTPTNTGFNWRNFGTAGIAPEKVQQMTESAMKVYGGADYYGKKGKVLGKVELTPAEKKAYAITMLIDGLSVMGVGDADLSVLNQKLKSIADRQVEFKYGGREFNITAPAKDKKAKKRIDNE